MNKLRLLPYSVLVLLLIAATDVCAQEFEKWEGKPNVQEGNGALRRSSTASTSGPTALPREGLYCWGTSRTDDIRPPRIASRNFVTGCLTSDVTGEG